MPDYRGGDAARRDTGGVYRRRRKPAQPIRWAKRGASSGKVYPFVKKIVMSLLFLWFIIKKCDIVM